MRGRAAVYIVVIVLLTAFQAGTALAGLELTRISDSVYSYVGVPEGTPGDAFSANAGIVIGDDAVLVVDTLTSAQEAEQFVKAVRMVTDKPIRYVVNTHYHLDHALGNNVFADMGAVIIAHKECREALLQTGEQTLQSAEAFGLPADFWEGTRVAAPAITFERELEIDLGNRSVRLIHSGLASHSPGSIFVVVPEQSVLFTGDILFTDFHPFLAEGDLQGWAETLDLLSALDVQHIVPGHGPLSDKSDLTEMKKYLVIFDENARRISADESDPEKITAEMMKILPQRSGGAFIVGMNVKMRYAGKSE